MYPKKLEIKARHSYFADTDCFSEAPWHLVHAYEHKNYRFNMHAHAFYEMNIITAGEGMHYIGDTALPAHVGDVFVIPPEVSHGYVAGSTLDICHVLLRSDFLSHYRAELSALPGFALLFDIEPQVRRTSGRSCHLHIAGSDLPDVCSQAARIIEAEAKGQYAYESVLTLGLIGMLGQMLQQSLAGESSSAHMGELLRVMEYVKGNLDRKLTLAELAALASVSAPTLNRHFREVLHTSPMQYVMQCRVQRARDLLAVGTLTKTEVAAACGFFDAAHLNKYL